MKKVRYVAILPPVTPAQCPLPTPYTRKAALINHDMWDCVLDMINRAKF